MEILIKNNLRNRNVWGYRLDKLHGPWFLNEIQQGRLRQGWGQDPKCNLSLNAPIPVAGGEYNRSIYFKVKKGDVLAIPNIDDDTKVTIVVATDDFDKGYRFQISNQCNKDGDPDYGHIFPVEYRGILPKSLLKANQWCPLRFWKMRKWGNFVISTARKHGIQI